eukprot:1350490-Pyramimonas_sp.AAC.1
MPPEESGYARRCPGDVAAHQLRAELAVLRLQTVQLQLQRPRAHLTIISPTAQPGRVPRPLRGVEFAAPGVEFAAPGVEFNRQRAPDNYKKGAARERLRANGTLPVVELPRIDSGK